MERYIQRPESAHAFVEAPVHTISGPVKVPTSLTPSINRIGHKYLLASELSPGEPEMILVDKVSSYIPPNLNPMPTYFHSNPMELLREGSVPVPWPARVDNSLDSLSVEPMTYSPRRVVSKFGAIGDGRPRSPKRSN